MHLAFIFEYSIFLDNSHKLYISFCAKACAEHQFSCSVLSNSLQPHGLQHARLLVNHQFSQLAQTHVHWVIDAIQPSNPLSFSSLPDFNLFQHQDFFQWVSSSHQVAKILVSVSVSILPMNIQNSFLLRWTGCISLQSKGLSRGVFSNTTVQKHHFYGTQLSL